MTDLWEPRIIMIMNKPMSEERREVRDEAIRMKVAGCTYAQIAGELGLTRQRIQQIVRPPSHVCLTVKRRANGCCEKCSTPTTVGHIHHKAPSESYNAPSNLAYLCLSCHRQEHPKVRQPSENTPTPDIPRGSSVSHQCNDGELYSWITRVASPKACPRCHGRLDRKKAA